MQGGRVGPVKARRKGKAFKEAGYATKEWRGGAARRGEERGGGCRGERGAPDK